MRLTHLSKKKRKRREDKQTEDRDREQINKQEKTHQSSCNKTYAEPRLDFFNLNPVFDKLSLNKSSKNPTQPDRETQHNIIEKKKKKLTGNGYLEDT